MDFFKQIRIVRKNILIISITKKGVIFEIAEPEGQKQTINGKVLPKFDYNNKIIFSLGDFEAAKVVRTIERVLFNPFNTCIKFPHYETKNPKTINFEFGMYKDRIQCGLTVFSNDRNIKIFLSEEEMEVLKEVLKYQYSIVSNIMVNFVEYAGENIKDDKEFKKAVFDILSKKGEN